jgi:hypothetical protein
MFLFGLFGLFIQVVIQAVLVYLAYFIASKGEEVDFKDAFTCALIIAVGSIGASYALEYTGWFVNILIWIAYLGGVVIVFALTTALPIKNAIIATVLYFIFHIVGGLLLGMMLLG